MSARASGIRETRFHRRRRQPGTERHLGQHRRGRQIAPFQEVGAEQRLDDLLLASVLGGERDQRVREQRVRLACDAFEREVDPDGPPHLGDTRIDFGAAAPEFALHVLRAWHPGFVQLRVELERAPRHLREGRLGPLLRVQLERSRETALADEAPWADHVRDDVDRKRHPHSPAPRRRAHPCLQPNRRP
ncbi:MAG: hypothetical protein M5U08_21115 [Burkholderiales bacterium]|nr:hypothetical protein [Burkholderiales bacterium]